jgi:hypothetical protein
VNEVSRRGFIVQASVVGAAAAAGGLAALPTLSSERRVGSGPAPESLVLHVRNIETAEVALLAGTEEIVYRDKQLVSSLLDAFNRSPRS